MTKMAFISLVLAMAVLAVSSTVSAAALSATITDPVGDATWHFNSGTESTRIPTYQDIAGASISKKGNTFTFSLDMAGALPVAPSPLTDGVKLNVWVWGITTDPAFSANGAPFPPGVSAFTQFDVRLHWDGASFSAFLLDRRRLATSAEAVFSAVPFAVVGAEIHVSVDAAAIDNPTSLFWLAITADWLSPHFGTNGFSYLDFALAPNGDLATWPS